MNINGLKKHRKRARYRISVLTNLINKEMEKMKFERDEYLLQKCLHIRSNYHQGIRNLNNKISIMKEEKEKLYSPMTNGSNSLRIKNNEN